MDFVSGKGILRGRPFGGVGILVNKRHAKFVKCLCKEERFIIILIYNIIIINVYLPVNTDNDIYSVCLLDILTSLSNTIGQYPDSKVIITGDFNCNIVDNSIGSTLIRQFMLEYKLLCCDSFCTSDISYTYHHATLDSRSYIDHFLISDYMEKDILSCDIVDSAVNFSDHLPVLLRIRIPNFQPAHDSFPVINHKHSRLRWDKANLECYYNTTYFNLCSKDISEFTGGSSEGICCNKNKVDELYNFIVNCLIDSANTSVPRTAHNFYKH